MMEKKYFFGVAAMAMIAVLGVSLVAAYPIGRGGFMGTSLTEEEKVELKENREEVREAIENNDYEVWKSLMEERIAKMQKSLTEENFAEIVEMHEYMNQLHEAMQEARETGDSPNSVPQESWGKVEELKEELGIENVNQGMGRGYKKGFRQGFRAHGMLE